MVRLLVVWALSFNDDVRVVDRQLLLGREVARPE